MYVIVHAGYLAIPKWKSQNLGGKTENRQIYCLLLARDLVHMYVSKLSVIIWWTWSTNLEIFRIWNMHQELQFHYRHLILQHGFLVLDRCSNILVLQYHKAWFIWNKILFNSYCDSGTYLFCLKFCTLVNCPFRKFEDMKYNADSHKTNGFFL